MPCSSQTPPAAKQKSALRTPIECVAKPRLRWPRSGVGPNRPSGRARGDCRCRPRLHPARRGGAGAAHRARPLSLPFRGRTAAAGRRTPGRRCSSPASRRFPCRPRLREFAAEARRADRACGTTLRVGLAPLANVDLGGPGLRRGIASAPVRRGLAHPGEVAVRQPRQALEPLVAKDLVLTPHHSPRGRSTQPAQRLVDLGEQPDVSRGVTPLKRARRTVPPVPNVPSPLVLTDQPRALRPRQPRDLRHKATHAPLVRLAQPGVVQPSQGPRHEVVRPRRSVKRKSTGSLPAMKSRTSSMVRTRSMSSFKIILR